MPGRVNCQVAELTITALREFGNCKFSAIHAKAETKYQICVDRPTPSVRI